MYQAQTAPKSRQKSVLLYLKKFFNQTIIDLAFLLEHLQDAGTKQLCQRTNIYSWHHIENTVLPKQTICKQHMDVGMPTGIVSNVWIAITASRIPLFRPVALRKK